MQHRGTTQIETERLILRRFVEKDAAAAFSNWESDETVTRFLRWKPCVSIEQTIQILHDWIVGYADNTFYQWAIVLKNRDDAPIGTISVVEQDEHTAAMEIGYCIGFAWWNKGYTSEALKAVLTFLFKQVGANRVMAQHDPNNPASGAVLRKCGFRYEGTLRQADFNNQGIVDAAVYGILAKEYNAI